MLLDQIASSTLDLSIHKYSSSNVEENITDFRDYAELRVEFFFK